MIFSSPSDATIFYFKMGTEDAKVLYGMLKPNLERNPVKVRHWRKRNSIDNGEKDLMVIVRGKEGPRRAISKKNRKIKIDGIEESGSRVCCKIAKKLILFET